MKLTRRNALIGLGAVATGGGALFGSGAFSSVTANRSATFSVTSDDSALLTFNATSQYATVGTATGNVGKGILEIDLGSLNDDATTTFEGVFSITNNSQDSAASYDIKIAESGSNGLTFEAAGTADGTDGNELTGSNVTLDQNQTVDVTIVVDTSSGDPTGVSQITVTAE